jgi:DNA topoisomerase-1
VKLIVEREREIQAFESASSFRIFGNFISFQDKKFFAELNKQLKSENEVMRFFSSLNNAEYQVEDVDVKP